MVIYGSHSHQKRRRSCLIKLTARQKLKRLDQLNPKIQLKEMHYEVTIGIPSGLIPPLSLGIFCSLIAAGWYVPSNSFEQIVSLYFWKCAFKSTVLIPSTPGFPPLRFTLR